jgi:type II secretory pathway component GspD/PulD (secretin)
MSIHRAAALAFVVILMTCLTIGFVGKVSAQGGNQTSFKFVGVDVRDALRDLCKSVNVSYSIAPNVQGTVTAEFKNITFEAGLQNILAQVGATFRLNAGVYEIIKNEPGPISSGGGFPMQGGFGLFPAPSPGSAIAQDSKFLYVLTGSCVYKLQKSDLKIVHSQALAQIGFNSNRY